MSAHRLSGKATRGATMTTASPVEALTARFRGAIIVRFECISWE